MLNSLQFLLNLIKKTMEFKISDNQRKWAETNFIFLLKSYGIPPNHGNQALLNSKYFSATFSEKETKIENILEDLKNILSLNSARISYEFSYDLRDSVGLPLAIQGEFDEMQLQKLNNNEYCILISNSVKDKPNKFIFSLINIILKIKLSELKINSEEIKFLEHFVFLAGIYFGLGVILTQKRKEVGYSTDGFWRTTWRFSSPMLDENIIYCFALYQNLFPNPNEVWVKELPSEIKSKLNVASNLINPDWKNLKRENNFSKNQFQNDEEKAKKIFSLSMQESKMGNFENSINSAKEILEISKDDVLVSSVYNNIGYWQLKLNLIEESIENFKKAIQFRPNFPYANDNLGYTLILQNNLDEGFEYLQRALKTEKNDLGFSYRNHGLYFHKKGELKKAKEHFELAFKYEKIPVDFLEFHYAELLFELGEVEKAKGFLELSVQKGEKISIEKYNEIVSRN